jgi:hypothetical protein
MEERLNREASTAETREESGGKNQSQARSRTRTGGNKTLGVVEWKHDRRIVDDREAVAAAKIVETRVGTTTITRTNESKEM